jgi:aspartate aminotransferase-like enzyme
MSRNLTQAEKRTLHVSRHVLNGGVTSMQASPGITLLPHEALAEVAGSYASEAPRFPSPLKEFSVIYTDRAMNLMAAPFTLHMQQLSATLKGAYNADHTCFVPGAGHFAMEAVARQFATGENVLVCRLGFFSFRWSAIMEQGNISARTSIITSRPVDGGNNPCFEPPPVEDVVAKIRSERPSVVFAPHVETSAGILLPDDYIAAIGNAVHEHGGVFVLDGIAAGAVWCDMKALGVDVYITAPQKGWSAPASVGIAMLTDRAREISKSRPSSTSFTLDLNKWMSVMDAYEKGGFMYYTTLPTDALVSFNHVAQELVAFGLPEARAAIFDLGAKIRKVVERKGFKVLAAPGWEAPGVVVVYTPDKEVAAKFKANGVQVAAGVPLMVDEPVERMDDRFRIGLFGLDKWKDVDGTVAQFEAAMDKVC